MSIHHLHLIKEMHLSDYLPFQVHNFIDWGQSIVDIESQDIILMGHSWFECQNFLRKFLCMPYFSQNFSRFLCPGV